MNAPFINRITDVNLSCTHSNQEKSMFDSMDFIENRLTATGRKKIHKRSKQGLEKSTNNFSI